MLNQELMWIGQFVLQSVLAVWPFFVITLLVATVIGALRLDGVVRAATSKKMWLAVILGAAVGAFSPFCSCSVIPVVRGLLFSGVPLAPVMAFWLASPTMDPEIFTLSVAMLGWKLAVARLIATLLMSIAGGYLTMLMVRMGVITGTGLADETMPLALTSVKNAIPAPQPVVIRLPMFAMRLNSGGEAVASAPTLTLPAWAGEALSGLRELNWKDVGRAVLRDHWKLGRWLALAFVLEALIVRYVPQAEVAGLLGTRSAFAVPLAALIGIPLYLGNMAAMPIVVGLLQQGMTPGAAIAFLIAGPVTTVPAMAAVWGIARKRVFFLYLGVSLISAVALGILADMTWAMW
jgi:hypothetical protein